MNQLSETLIGALEELYDRMQMIMPEGTKRRIQESVSDLVAVL